MWNIELLGTDVYHIVACFIIYSVLGWLLESTYMSICNRKFTNRGFAFSPFCPIYGFGAVTGYLLLHPFADNVVKLYLLGAVSATIFEFLVGKLMIGLFGELWWDYNDKPFNYKGIICAESTVAWGFYAVGIIVFLNNHVVQFIDRYNVGSGIMLCRFILVVFLIDFSYHFIQAMGINLGKYREKIHQKYDSFKARWY
ncbi:MAG: putative ABC transporter permease [Acetivibrio sp.]